jgi:biopolymer transport protein ExbD
MIDCMFQLVLFLLVSATFTDTPTIDVDLPKARSQQAVVTEKEDLDVWMATNGSVFVGDEAVSSDRLEALFHRAAERDPSTLVVIRADAGVSHGQVVGVMDLARTEGLHRLAIATESRTEPTL